MKHLLLDFATRTPGDNDKRSGTRILGRVSSISSSEITLSFSTPCTYGAVTVDSVDAIRIIRMLEQLVDALEPGAFSPLPDDDANADGIKALAMADKRAVEDRNV